LFERTRSQATQRLPIEAAQFGQATVRQLGPLWQFAGPLQFDVIPLQTPAMLQFGADPGQLAQTAPALPHAPASCAAVEMHVPAALQQP